MKQMQSSIDGRKSRRRGALAGLCAVFALAAGGLHYAGWSIDFPLLPSLSSRFATTGYPVRIALGGPRTVPPSAKSATSADLAQTAGELSAEQGVTPLSSQMPMILPVKPEAEPGALAGSPIVLRSGAADPGSARFLKVNYNLAQSDSEDAIVVRKSLIVDDVESGAVEIRIAGSANLSIRSKDLIAIGGARFKSMVEDVLRNAEFVNFDQLRSLGVMIRYDAIKDRVLVSSASA